MTRPKAADPLVLAVAALYALALLLAPAKALQALLVGARSLGSVALIILSVFAVLGLVSVFLDKRKVAERLGEGSGPRAVVLGALFGTLLVGPVFAVFPLLKSMREHGARWAVVVAVMTAWAVKLPMIPLEVRFLGWEFSALRSVLTIGAAVALGFVMERLMCPGLLRGEPCVSLPGEEARGEAA